MYSLLRAHRLAPSIVKMACLVFLVVLVSGCGGGTTVTKPTPTPTSQFTPLDLGIPQVALNAPVTGALAASQILHVGVSFKLNQATVDTWNKLNGNNHVQKGSSDATTIANQLGITDAQYQRIKSYLGIADAKLTLNKLHTYLAVDAKVSTINAVFHTKLVQHQLNGRTFYTPDSSMPPEVPTAIASQILSVTGLENYSTFKTGVSAQTLQQTSHLAPHKPTTDCSPDPSTYNTDQIATAYGYKTFWQHGFKGQGLTVNLIEIDTFDPNDILNYAQCVGYNTKNFHFVSLDGEPQPSSEPAIESTLDIDMLMGLAPQASIVDYQTGLASGQGINDALQQLINDNAHNVNSASVVSISIGGAEAYQSSADITAIESSLHQLDAIEHMTVFVSSGDCAAYGDGNYGDLSVQFPASAPLSVAVGGTEWNTGANGSINETVWSDGSNKSKCSNAWGSGGGLSIKGKRPSWEVGKGVHNKYSNGMRQVPDVSALANTIAVYALGAWQSIGGTSAATPIWAAGFMLVNNALIAHANGTFFYGPAVFYEVINSANRYRPYNDVTQGTNLFYPATPGWDFATGWGSPNLVDFYLVLYNAAKSGH